MRKMFSSSCQFPGGGFYVEEETYTLDHLTKDVSGLLKFGKECDNSTVSFLTEIGFGNNGNRCIDISDLGSGMSD